MYVILKSSNTLQIVNTIRTYSSNNITFFFITFTEEEKPMLSLFTTMKIFPEKLSAYQLLKSMICVPEFTIVHLRHLKVEMKEKNKERVPAIVLMKSGCWLCQIYGLQEYSLAFTACREKKKFHL